MICVTRSESETFALGRALGSLLQKGDTVLLYGDLGCGKSVLARGCASALGVTESMASPTFTLMQPYAGNDFPVYHYDLYRLSGADELFYSGLEEHIGSDGVALIEWPQQGDVCPPRRVEIDMERMEEENARRVTVTLCGMEESAGALENALKAFEI